MTCYGQLSGISGELVEFRGDLLPVILMPFHHLLLRFADFMMLRLNPFSRSRYYEQDIVKVATFEDDQLPKAQNPALLVTGVFSERSNAVN